MKADEGEVLRPADLLFEDSWFNIVQAISRGDHPRPEHLASALRRGEAVPPEVQGYLAGLLDGSIKRRGAPSKWKDPFRLVLLRRQIDKTRSLMEDGRMPCPKGATAAEAAYEAMAKQHNIDVTTAKKYYAIAGRLLDRFAREGWPRQGVKLGDAVRPVELVDVPPPSEREERIK